MKANPPVPQARFSPEKVRARLPMVLVLRLVKNRRGLSTNKIIFAARREFSFDDEGPRFTKHWSST